MTKISSAFSMVDKRCAITNTVRSFFSSSNKALQYVQNTIFKGIKFGYGSALAWIYFAIVSIILIVVAGLISRKVFYYDK